MLDDEQRVAFVAQVVHHAHQPADVARMQADARLVHDEERVDERGAETGREVDALHFAAAQGAGGAVEREIADADFAEIIAGAHRFRRAASRAVESLGERLDRWSENRAPREIGKRLRIREALANGRCHRRSGGETELRFVIERLGLETSAVAARATGVSAVAAEQNAHMHFVGLALEPSEEAADAIPAIVFVIFLGVFAARFSPLMTKS